MNWIKFLPKPVLQTIYYRSILPSVWYSIVVWGLCSEPLLEDIDGIHLRATKIIHGLSRETCSSEVRSTALWNPIISFYIKRPLNSSFIIYNGTTIDPLRDLIVKPEIKYNFRKSTNIVVTRPRTEIGRSSFKHRTGLSWNLPNSFKNYTSLSNFKRLIRDKVFLKTILSFQKASLAFLLSQWT